MRGLGLGLGRRLNRARRSVSRAIAPAAGPAARPAAPAAAATPPAAPQPVAPAAAPPAPPAPEPTAWTREGTFGERFTDRALADFVDPAEPVDWTDRNPFEDLPHDALLEQAMGEWKWRYHHQIPALRESEEFYTAYADRVDAMLEMLDAALALGGVDPGASSFLDIGAAEGYVVNHLLDRGATDVDAVELNQTNIDRIWMIRALRGFRTGRVGRIDLDRVAWARSLGRTYDITLALGVIYHMENPMLFARNLFAATGRLAVVESDTPVLPGNKRFRGYGNIYLHRDQVSLVKGDVRYLTELRPDRQALAEILLAAGFSRVEVVPAATGNPSRYFSSGEKTLMVAHV